MHTRRAVIRWEIAIVIGIQDFGVRDRIWKWRPNLEIVILLREIGGHCMPP